MNMGAINTQIVNLVQVLKKLQLEISGSLDTKKFRFNIISFTEGNRTSVITYLFAEGHSTWVISCN